MKKTVLFILYLLTCSLPSWGTTWYVDITNGLDTNNGTTKTTAFAHAPGMKDCTNTCLSTTPQPGDSVILRGGETWGNASFDWSLPGGTSGGNVYVGVDKTWYTGGSWTRPILDAGGIAISNNDDTMFYAPSYVTVDNFEIKGFYWSLAACTSSPPYGECGIFEASQNQGQIFENLYIHGWTHAGTGSGSNNYVSTVFAFGGNATGTAHDNVIVGTDVAGDHSMSVFWDGPLIAYNNYIQQVSSGFVTSSVGGTSIVHDNYIWDIGPAYCNTSPPDPGNCTHENGYEDNGDTGLYFYNNVVGNETDGLALWIAPNPTYSAYLWNNVVYDVHNDQIVDFAPPVYTNSTICPSGSTDNNYCTAAGNYYMWNNTVQCGDDSTQYDVCQSGLSTAVGPNTTANSVTFQNNHFISLTTASGCSNPTGCTFTNNVVQTLATANTQGYTSGSPSFTSFAFEPTQSGGSTMGAGTNLTSSASGNLSTLAASTTYACANSSNTASCPALATIGRVASGNWQAGAYWFAGSSTPTPASGILLITGIQ